MKATHFILTALLGFIVFQSCNPAKKFIKEGDACFIIGNYDDAANFYYNALLVQPGNRIASEALKKSANNVLTGKFTQFGKYVVENQPEDAVIQYKYNKKYYQKVKQVGVQLDWPAMYNDIYEDIRSEFVSKTFDGCFKLIEEKKYDKAEKTLDDLSKLDSVFSTVSVLRINSVYQALFEEGLRQMESKRFKAAFADFDQLYKEAPNFSQVKQKRQAALDSASSILAIFPVQSLTNNEVPIYGLNHEMFASMVKFQGQFLKIVEGKNLEINLRNHGFQLDSLFDPELAAVAGKACGFQYILRIGVTSYTAEEYPEKSDSITGFEAFNTVNPHPGPGQAAYVTRFKKVKYARTYSKNKVNSKIVYSLLSVQTGQAATEDAFENEQISENEIFRYNGNVNQLYPDLPVGKSLPAVPVEWREKFSALKDPIDDLSQLNNKMWSELADKVAEDIQVYIEK